MSEPVTPHTPETSPQFFDSKAAAMSAYDTLRDMQSEAGRRCQWGSRGTDADRQEYAETTEALDILKEQILSQFGKVNPKFPDCKQCVWASVFGGPGHVGSSYCRSGKRPHCTCDSCF